MEVAVAVAVAVAVGVVAVVAVVPEVVAIIVVLATKTPFLPMRRPAVFEDPEVHRKVVDRWSSLLTPAKLTFSWLSRSHFQKKHPKKITAKNMSTMI